MRLKNIRRILSNALCGEHAVSQHRKTRNRVLARIEPCERRVLMSTVYIPWSDGAGPIQGETFNMRWINGSAMEWKITSNPNSIYQAIPPADEGGNPYNDINVDGDGGDEALTLDFSYGAFPQAVSDPTIEFTAPGNAGGGSLGNKLIVVGGDGNDSVVLEPNSISFTDGNGNSTAISYDASVSQVVLELGGGSNSITLDAGESFIFDSTSLPASGNNGTLSLAVQNTTTNITALRSTMK